MTERIGDSPFVECVEITVADIYSFLILCVVDVFYQVTHPSVQLPVERVVERFVGIQDREVVCRRLLPVVLRHCRRQMAARIYSAGND